MNYISILSLFLYLRPSVKIFPLFTIKVIKSIILIKELQKIRLMLSK